MLLLLCLAPGIATFFPWRARAEEHDFVCPKAGLRARYEVMEVEYFGPTKDDRYNCVHTTRTGKGSFLFNYYWVEKDDYDEVRAKLAGLFTHKLQATSFSYTSAGNRQRYKDSWKFLRVEAVFVGDRRVDAEVYERHNEGQLGNNHHSIWTLWFDPRTGLWIKNTVSVVSGQAMGVTTNGSLISITEP
jgi:hypothetical protein